MTDNKIEPHSLPLIDKRSRDVDVAGNTLSRVIGLHKSLSRATSAKVASQHLSGSLQGGEILDRQPGPVYAGNIGRLQRMGDEVVRLTPPATGKHYTVAFNWREEIEQYKVEAGTSSAHQCNSCLNYYTDEGFKDSRRLVSSRGGGYGNRKSAYEYCISCEQIFPLFRARYKTWYFVEKITAVAKCASTIECGEGKTSPHHSSIIQFDHIDKEDKQERQLEMVREKLDAGKVVTDSMLSVGRMSGIYTLKENGKLVNELTKVRPLCSNCHSKQSKYENSAYSSKTFPVVEIETDPKIMAEFHKIVDAAIKNWKGLKLKEIIEVIREPNFDMFNNCDFYLIERNRNSNNLFLKN